jgi:hypothetical protein
MSFTPTEIAAEIKNTFLNLPSLMEPDFRQKNSRQLASKY